MHRRIVAAMALAGLTAPTAAACGVIVDIVGPVPTEDGGDVPPAPTTDAGSDTVTPIDAARDARTGDSSTYECAPLAVRTFEAGASCTAAASVECVIVVEDAAGPVYATGAPCEAGARLCSCIEGTASEWLLQGTDCRCPVR